MNPLAVLPLGFALAMGLGNTNAVLRAGNDIELARRLENAFVSVAERASQWVVVITTTRKISSDEPDQLEEKWSRQFESTPFEFFFRHRQPPPRYPRQNTAQGSGIVYRRDGFLLTNNHVVDGADKIQVRLKDGRSFEATRIGYDELTDVAVLQVQACDLPAAQLGDSDSVKVGQWAIAIGAPYELDYTFTVGFVSAKSRTGISTRSGTAYEDYIQTDAAINPGNSGGPLCDIEGRVVGMNTLIAGLNRGIGFAIPINMVRQVADELIARGRVARPWLGIQIDALANDDELAGTLKDVANGVVVREIHPNTPAAASELKPADVIVAVDDVPVKTPRDLQRQVLSKKIGQDVKLDVVRGTQRLALNIKTAEMPSETSVATRSQPATEKTVAPLGLSVQPLSPAQAAELGLPPGNGGVLVTNVADQSPAAEKGLQVGDVITAVDRQIVRDVAEFAAAIRKADPKKGVLVHVYRNGVATFVVLKDE